MAKILVTPIKSSGYPPYYVEGDTLTSKYNEEFGLIYYIDGRSFPADIVTLIDVHSDNSYPLGRYDFNGNIYLERTSKEELKFTLKEAYIIAATLIESLELPDSISMQIADKIGLEEY